MKKLQLFVFFLVVIAWSYLWQIQQEINSVDQEVAGQKFQSGELQMTFLDIGQGDATLIDFANGEQMLIDCAIDGRILEALGRNMSFTDKKIDYLVVTHPDLDHYGGCVEVMERFDVGEVWYSGIKKEHDTSWQEFWYTVNDGTRVYREIDSAAQFAIASTTVDILYPDHSLVFNSDIPGEKKEANANNTSIVMQVRAGNTSVLLTGDAEEELEEYLVRRYGEKLRSHILKMGHHGSASSSIQPFLDMVQPRDTIASAGFENKYSHPSTRVLKRFERMETNVWRTDVQGDIVLDIGGGEYTITSQF